MNEVVKTKEPGTSVAVVTPMRLLEIATEQNADVDKLAKLMDLQDRYEATEAKKAFIAAMVSFHEKCPAISKTLTGHNGRYAGLAETLAIIKPLMKECGFTHSWKTEVHDTILVTCIITHAGGHSESSSMSGPPDVSGNKNSLQAIGSTNKYLQRYTLFDVLGLASSEHDDDGNGSCMAITEEQKARIVDLLKSRGVSTKRLLDFASTLCKREIKSVDEIPEDKYEIVMQRINTVDGPDK